MSVLCGLARVHTVDRTWHGTHAFCPVEPVWEGEPTLCPGETLLGWCTMAGAISAFSAFGESPGAPSIRPSKDWEEIRLKEMCAVCSFWWVLHSFLVKYCAWKTRIYGQHSSYKQSNCTLWRNDFAMTGELSWLPCPHHVVLRAADVGRGRSVPG